MRVCGSCKVSRLRTTCSIDCLRVLAGARRRPYLAKGPEWPFAVQMGSINEPRDSPNEPHASSPGGFPSAFNRGSPVEPSIEALPPFHTRMVRAVPEGHSAKDAPRGRTKVRSAPHPWRRPSQSCPKSSARLGVE